MSTSVEGIWQAIKNGRGHNVDWFSEQTPAATLAITLTAMANSQGGTILMGIAGPTATPMGVRDAESTIDRVLQAALSIEPPLIIPFPRVVLLKGQSVVVVSIPHGMPHVYSYDG